MKGLILKDIYLNKKNFFLITIIFAINAFQLRSEMSELDINMFSFILILIISATGEFLTSENINKYWYDFLYSSPLSKKTIIAEKYILDLIFISIGMALSIIYIYICNIHMNISFSFKEMFGVMFSISIILLNSAINKPLLYKYGENCAKTFTISFFLCMLLCFISIFVCIELNMLNLVDNMYLEYISISALFITICLHVISHLISVKIVLNNKQ